MENLFPIQDQFVPRADREKLLGQRGMVLWLTGLSGSGKSTIAKYAEKHLVDRHRLVYILDGDNIRTGLNQGLGFSLEDRQENIRRIAEVAKLMADAGIICLCCFVSPTKTIREQARSIIGNDDFFLVHVATDLAICEERDVKGLYAKARKGEIKGFTGIDSPFEIPDSPALTIETKDQKPQTSGRLLADWIEQAIEKTA